MQEMQTAAGAADAEMKVVEESLDFRINRLKQTWVSTIQGLIDRGDIGELIDLFTKLSEVIGKLIDKLGLLGTIGVGVGIFGGIKAFKNFDTILGTLTKFSQLGEIVNLGKNGVNTLETVSKIADAIIDMDDAQKIAVISAMKLSEVQATQVLLTAGVKSETIEAAVAQGTLATSENVTTGSTISLSNAYRGLAASLGISTAALTAFIAAAAGIAIGISAWIAYKQHIKETAIAAAESAEAIQEEQSAIDGQISKYKELKEKLKDINLTEDEQYEIKKQLYELQKSLNETYGDEATKLDLVNGKYETQLELLRQISQEQAQGYIQEHQFDYSKAENRLNTAKNRTLNFSDAQADIDPRIIKYLKGYSGLRDLNEDGSGPAAFSIKLNDEEAEATLRKLYDDVEKFGKNTGANVESTLGVISKHITDITSNETFQADKKFVAEFNKQAVLADNDLRSVYAKGLDAVEQYNKALAMNDGISEARKNLNAVRSEFDLYKNNVSGSEEVFQSVWDNINTSAERTLLIEERLSDKTTHAFELAEKLKGVNDFELKDIDFDSANLNEGEQAFVDLANSLGIDADNTQGLIDKLVELGFVIGSTTDKVEELGKASEDSFNFTKDISDLKDLEDELNKLGTAMSNIDESGQFQLGDLDSIADYFLALEQGGENAAYKAEEVGNALKLLGEGTGTIEQQADAINTLADQYIRTSNVLAGLNEQNKQLYITRLEEMGIINAETIVEQELLAAKDDVINAQIVEEASTIDLTNVKEALVSADENAINATIAEIQALLDESNASDATRAAIFNLVAQQTVFNNQGLDVNGKIEALEKLANAFLTTAEAARFEAEISTVASQAKNMSKAGGMPSDVAAKINKSVESKTKQFSSSIGKQTVTFEKAQYNGGSSVKNKLGTTPTSTGGALKDLRNKAAQDAADKAGGGGGSKDPTEEAKKDEEELEDTYDEFFDYFERRLKVVSDAISLLDAHLENVVGSNAKNTLLDAQMRIYKMQQQEYADAQNMYQEMADKALAKIEDSNIVEKIKNGAVGIDEFIGKGNEEVVNAINDYTKWADKVADCKQQLAELKETIRQLELTRMKNILQDWQDVFDLRQDNAIDLIDKQISLIEESGNLVGKAFYEQQKRQTEGQISAMEQAKRELSAELNRGLANGSIEVGTDEWIEEVGLLQEVESNILDCKQAIEEYDNAILAIHTDTFERLIDKLDDLDDELSDIAAFFDDEKVGDKFGNWSEAGQAQAGLLAQQYELAQNKVKKYAEQIDWLNGQYNAGKYSTTEYTEQLAELMDAMRESAKDAESAKEAMLDLNKARVDIVIDGINEEIEAYSDLISKEKDALSAEKDLHDYRKQIAESNKSIVAIQKQLAAIENDNSQKARAQRAKLQQQLKDAQDALAEQEYDHSVEMQQQALDEQLEQYKDTRQKEIDELNAYVENSQQVLTDMFESVRANAESIGQTIVQTAQEHGFQVSTSLTESWKAGENAIASYGAVLTPATSEFIAQLENVEQQTWDLQDQADKTAVSLADMFGTRADTLVGELQRSWQAEANAQAMADALRQSMVYALESGYDISSVVSSLNSVANAAKDVADAANDAASALDNAISKQDTYNKMPKSSGNENVTITTLYNAPNTQATRNNTTGKITQQSASDLAKKYKKKYARGLSKAEKDELAWTQELGSEIIISPTRNSILTPIKKNDGVLNAQDTANIFEWAKISPSEFFNRSQPQVNMPNITKANQTIVHFESLINVNGNVNDSMEMMKIAANEANNKLKETFRNINNGLRR